MVQIKSMKWVRIILPPITIDHLSRSTHILQIVYDTLFYQNSIESAKLEMFSEMYDTAYSDIVTELMLNELWRDVDSVFDTMYDILSLYLTERLQWLREENYTSIYEINFIDTGVVIILLSK